MKMNRELYYALITYLEQRELPTHIDKWTTAIIHQQYKQFESRKQVLYKISGERTLLVIHEHRKEEVMKLNHNRGHLGTNNTYYQMKQHSWWPGMEEDIRTFVCTCDTCQKYKQDRKDTTTGSAKIRPEPFAHIGLDIVGPLPITLQGHRYIIVAVDFFTKWIEAEVLKEANAQNIAEFIHKEIICHHRYQLEITTNRGTEFNNQLISNLLHTYQIKHIKMTLYYPKEIDKPNG